MCRIHRHNHLPRTPSPHSPAGTHIAHLRTARCWRSRFRRCHRSHRLHTPSRRSPPPHTRMLPAPCSRSRCHTCRTIPHNRRRHTLCPRTAARKPPCRHRAGNTATPPNTPRTCRHTGHPHTPPRCTAAHTARRMHPPSYTPSSQCTPRTPHHTDRLHTPSRRIPARRVPRTALLHCTPGSPRTPRTPLHIHHRRMPSRRTEARTDRPLHTGRPGTRRRRRTGTRLSGRTSRRTARCNSSPRLHHTPPPLPRPGPRPTTDIPTHLDSSVPPPGCAQAYAQPAARRYALAHHFVGQQKPSLRSAKGKKNE